MTPLHWVAHRFVRQAALTPNAIALQFGEETMTYAEAEARSGGLAASLQACGAAPGGLVALCVERSFDLVLGVLAIARTGAAYLPIDTDCPLERMTFILDDASVALVVSHGEWAERARALGRRVVDLAAKVPPGSPGLPNLTADDIAYVIYTSGTTGRPKGVLVTQHNLARLFEITAADFKFCAEDVWCLFHSIAFDFSVWELWGALLHGGRLVVASQLAAQDPAELLDLIRQSRVTVLNQTPSAFARLSAEWQRHGSPLSDLRWLIFGGERLAPAMLHPWMEGHIDLPFRIVNMYGITETTVHVTFREIGAADCARSVSPIGRPLGDLHIRLLDPAGVEVGPGEAGELCVFGPAVSAGYLNRPELTAERFPWDPRGPAGARYYRSGDLAKLNALGEFEYLGRADDQVKIRGFRVELSEIEYQLASLDEISTVVALVLGEGDEAEIAVAYQGSLDAVDQLQQRVRDVLPRYMWPTRYVRVAEIPLTLQGKIDRLGLLPLVTAPAPTVVAEPAAGAEAVLLSIWRAQLKAPRLEMDDNFFEHGAHSVLILRGLSKVEAELGHKFTFREVFQQPTVRALLAKLTADDQVRSGVLPS